MRILLTGATGFVGCHLMPLLLKEGHEVFCLVRNYTGNSNEFLWDFSGQLPKDLPDCDFVIHLAAYVNFGSKMDKEQYVINTISTARLVQLCVKMNAMLIFASTVGVHGSFSPVSICIPANPNTHYGMSKYLAEQIIHIFLSGAFILRICGIYGFNGPEHLGLNTAITNAAKKGLVPILRGAGYGKRNYICVQDVAKWICFLIENENCDGVQTIYMAGDEIMTIEGYLQEIRNVFCPELQIVKESGKDSLDYVLEPSVPPFALTKFRDYLKKVKEFYCNSID